MPKGKKTLQTHKGHSPSTERGSFRADRGERGLKRKSIFETALFSKKNPPQHETPPKKKKKQKKKKKKPKTKQNKKPPHQKNTKKKKKR